MAGNSDKPRERAHKTSREDFLHVKCEASVRYCCSIVRIQWCSVDVEPAMVADGIKPVLV